jgi:hypothetical protein
MQYLMLYDTEVFGANFSSVESAAFACDKNLQMVRLSRLL